MSTNPITNNILRKSISSTREVVKKETHDIYEPQILKSLAADGFDFDYSEDPPEDDSCMKSMIESMFVDQPRTTREKGKTTAATCGSFGYMTDPRSGLTKKFPKKCLACPSCLSEISKDITRGLVSREVYHGGYLIKRCDNKEALRLMKLIGKDNVLRFPFGENWNIVFLSRRALEISKEQISKCQTIESISEIGYQEFSNLVATILGDKPLDRRKSGALHKNNSSDAYDAFNNDDSFDEYAAMEFEDIIEGATEITYYSISFKADIPVSLERIGSSALLESIEKTMHEIPETLDEVQKIIDKKKDIFVAAVKHTSEVTGLKIEVRVKHYKTLMLPSEICWSEKLIRESAARLRHNMNYFSDTTKVFVPDPLEREKVPIPT